MIDQNISQSLRSYASKLYEGLEIGITITAPRVVLLVIPPYCLPDILVDKEGEVETSFFFFSIMNSLPDISIYYIFSKLLKCQTSVQFLEWWCGASIISRLDKIWRET